MSREGGPALLAGLLLVLAASAAPALARDAGTPDWITIDYSELVDRRQLSHSGESVGQLLGRLGGRALPPPGTRPEDRMSHALLDPLLEPYAFVLSDTLDTLGGWEGGPPIEVGSLWPPGAAQPAWVELLRARRFLVESDGAGHMRAFLPWLAPPGTAAREPAVPGSEVAAEEALRRAWPILRHVVAAERLRLEGASAAPPKPIRLDVHAYRHRRELSAFLLGTAAHRSSIDDTRPDGMRPPLDLESFRRLLGRGLTLEGARVRENGSVVLLGSEAEDPPEMLGRPVELSDLAVAYRATFHGGLAEPYMSLDRGFTPQTTIVNYGGRLRDTALGLVSLLCDIRFKTFSVGLDVVAGRDLRRELREKLPGFKTHWEHLAADPGSAGLLDQQTRLWFYPDDVDLTLSLEGDLVVMRRARMSAASERVEAATLLASPGEDPPWTRATVAAINENYDTLAEVLPELGDLDQVVRLLSLFTWMKQASAEGYLMPELDALLAVELPPLVTPRTFPQLLAFNGLPEAGSAAPVEVFDRLEISEAQHRLEPAAGRPLPARVRYDRAVAALDPTHPGQAELLAEFGGYDPARMADGMLDLLAWRAERARMHQRVLGTLGGTERQRVVRRREAGESIRVFSVGIGGLDLDMSKVLARASGRRIGLGRGLYGVGGSQVGGSAPTRARPASPGEPRQEWRRDPPGIAGTRLPAHGVGAFETVSVERSVSEEAGARRTTTFVVYDADGPEPRTRSVVTDSSGLAGIIERLEAGRLLRYRLVTQGPNLVADRLDLVTPAPDPGAPRAEIPPGLGLFSVGAGAAATSPALPIRLGVARDGEALNLEADLPRTVLQRLALGRAADMTPGRPVPGFAPLPPAMSEIETMMVLLAPAERALPWTPGAVPLPGEEAAATLARALGDWWSGAGQRRAAVVGCDPAASPDRWQVAPAVESGLMWLPEEGFPASAPLKREVLARAWSEGRTVATLPERIDADLVVLVSAEPPALFAARLRALARSGAMKGKFLAAWCLSGPVRPDLPASLLAEGNLAGLGLADAGVSTLRGAAARIQDIGAMLEAPPVRAERLPGPFLWYF